MGKTQKCLETHLGYLNFNKAYGFKNAPHKTILV